MSLNFVASSVLQVADGVNDETEQQIENAETANMRRNAKSSGGIGLFDQLQKNKDDKEEAMMEKRNSLMGVRPLEEEDVQHLNSYLERKTEAREKRKLEDDAEVEIFKRTREMRKGGVLDIGGGGEGEGEGKERGVEGGVGGGGGGEGGGGEGGGAKAAEKANKVEVAEVKIKVKKLKKRKVEKKVEKVEESSNLFGAYGSDSD
ncbi:hypothetical protein TrCOL_g4845 [Triparma columacea]|uniref:FAM192A/Fyv6 N-terminal domain-containing protein n=1 Tax=Triparma columacea TaxID=722753 RepID=A0A9W7LEA7_9STRA|nr:hypothetical protein TrCOL_g4845 [Triparma columacea]